VRSQYARNEEGLGGGKNKLLEDLLGVG
jgi:hypothetical protein